MMKRMMMPAGRGSVLVISALLLASASVRIVTSANSAFAQDSQLPTTPSQATHTAVPDETPQSPAYAPLSEIDAKGNLSNLVKALHEREVQVAEREKQLEMRLRALSVADAEIEKRLIALTEMETTLRATLALADEASEKDLLRLTAVYESMKPKDAAVLFEQMDSSFSAGFLARMRPDVAAEIMSGLSPQAAYSISVILAGRNANAPKS